MMDPNDRPTMTPRRYAILAAAVFIACWLMVGWLANALTQPWWNTIMFLANVTMLVLGALESKTMLRMIEETNQASTASGAGPLPKEPSYAPATPPPHSSATSSLPPTTVAAIRSFASLRDGQEHGWEFSEQIGVFNGEPVYKMARHAQTVWEFDGLAPTASPPVVLDINRIFGRLRYRQHRPEEQNNTDPTPASA